MTLKANHRRSQQSGANVQQVVQRDDLDRLQGQAAASRRKGHGDAEGCFERLRSRDCRDVSISVIPGM